MCGYDTDIAEHSGALVKLAQLERDGLVTMNDQHAKITSKAGPFAPVTASCFDFYLEPGEGQHARAN